MANIVLIGAPGSGKSSIAAQFQRQSGGAYEHISSGNIARRLATEDDLADTALRRGDYAPEAAMRSEIVSEIERVQFAGHSFVLEGFPRLLAQVVVLEKALEEPPIYVEVFCPLHICLKRAIARGREHDKPDAIASRFEAYERDTLPVLRMVEDNGGEGRYHKLLNIEAPSIAVGRLAEIARIYEQ